MAWPKGRKHDPETAAKISAANTGKTRSAETRAKISAAKTGKTHSAEARAKMSAAKTGKTHSAEARAKMSAAKTGKTHSAETRAKLGAAMRVRMADPAFRAKIAAARRALAPDRASQQALAFLLQSGEAMEIGPDLVLASSAFEAAEGRVRQHLRERGAATASELRELLGTTRRVLIPLLERLDRLGITRRDGDLRRLGPRSEPG